MIPYVVNLFSYIQYSKSRFQRHGPLAIMYLNCKNNTNKINWHIGQYIKIVVEVDEKIIFEIIL